MTLEEALAVNKGVAMIQKELMEARARAEQAERKLAQLRASIAAWKEKHEDFEVHRQAWWELEQLLLEKL